MTMIYDYDGNLVLINLAIWLWSVFYYRRILKHGSNKVSLNFRMVWFFLTLFSTFAFSSADTYHYKYLFNEMIKYQEMIHVEPFYFYLTKYISNYYLWRFVIWGGAALLMVISLKKSNHDAFTVGALLPCFVYVQFSLTRGALGFALLMFALSLLYSEKKSKLRYPIFALLIGISYYLHRSMPLFIIFLSLAYFFPLQKKFFYLSLIVFPFLYVSIALYLDPIIGYLTVNDDFTHSANTYKTMESTKANWKGMIQMGVQWLGIIMLMYSMYKFYIKNVDSCSKVNQFMFKYSYVLIYISMLFCGQPFTDFLYTRCIHASTFPLMFCASDYFYNTQRSKFDKYTFYILLVYMLYSIALFIWKWR